MSEKRKINKKIKIILIVLPMLLTAIALGGFGIVKGYLNQIGRVEDSVTDTIPPEDEFFDVDEEPVPPAFDDKQGNPLPSDDLKGEAVQPGQAEGAADTPSQDGNVTIDPGAVKWNVVEPVDDDHLINILLVGQDKDITMTGRKRSDTMILCSINSETGAVSLISFLRDLYVQIPGGYSNNRLNVPYVFGGFDLLDRTLTANFGVSVDANFEVDLNGFQKLIDVLGGIEIQLTAAEAEYLKATWDITATEGINQFDGRQTMWYSRIRKLDSDFGRSGRQRKVLLAVYQKIKDLPMNELLPLMYDILPYLTTDMTDAEILSLAYRFLPLLPSMKIETHTVPARGTYQNASIRGMAVLLPDRALIREKLIGEYLPLG